jgi:hypothetical protein
MKTYKALILGSAAGLLAVGGAQAADLPMKAKAVEYVKICSLYGAGFYYIPGTDTCIRIGGALRLDVAFNAGTFDSAYWLGGTSGTGASNSIAYGKNWFAERARLNMTEDTRTATEYGVLRTYANMQFDWNNNGNSGIAGGAPVEVDYAFIQFAGFTMGKSVSMFDTQWVLSKPTISSGFFSGSNNATGISQLAYTWSFGNGVSATLSLEDGQPYRTAGLVNVSQATLNQLIQSTPPTGSYGVGNFTATPSPAIMFRKSLATFVSIRLGAICTSVPRLMKCMATTTAVVPSLRPTLLRSSSATTVIRRQPTAMPSRVRLS